MSKKDKRPRGWLRTPKQIEDLVEKASYHVVRGNHKRVLKICKRIQRYIPSDAKPRAEALVYMAHAYVQLKRFQEAHEALTKALEITPDDPILWFNRSLTSMYTSRSGQALKDAERAVELEGDGKMAKEYIERLNFLRPLTESEIKDRGPDFTLEELIEQQELYQRGVRHMDDEEWEKAEQCFRETIEIRDCLHQPWGNLGMVLLMQERYDEAEKALKRSLEIKPTYQHALINLASLESLREEGGPPPKRFVQTSPFQDKDIGVSYIFEDE